MHVTNGIAIQLKQEKNTERDTSQTIRATTQERKRSFSPLPNDISQYNGKKREEPRNINVASENSSNLSEISRLMDVFWVLLRMSFSSVPSWKGFNYLIDLTKMNLCTLSATSQPSTNRQQSSTPY